MLSPYRVLDLTDNEALLAGQILGDLGADVIVVEPPDGGEARHRGPYFHDTPHIDRSLTWWGMNRNKRSITIDLHSQEGTRRLRELVAGTDFLFESFAPGYLDSLGLGYAALSALNPRLVMVSITPFGQDGPKSSWAATDLTCMAASGVLLMTGDDDRPPVAVSVPQAFLHAAGEAAVAALVAHFGRERDGAGQHVDVSAQAAAIIATQATAMSSAWGDKPTKRMAGGVNFGGIPLRFVNPARDGFVSVTFLFGTAIGPFSRRLMEVMHEEGIVDADTRDKDWLNYTNLLISGKEPLSELLRCMDAIARWTSRHTRAELLETAMERSLLIVPVNTTADVVNSEQLAARKFWMPIEHPELGEHITYPGPFARLTATPISTRRRPPLLGEHNEEVANERRELRPAAPAADAPADLPLRGIKVADFMWVAAGPWGIRFLADYGATVVHVESPTRIDTARTIAPFKDGQPGPGRSGAWATLNAGKLGLTLHLSMEQGRDIALRLARWADVVTDSFSPGVMMRLGLDYDTLRRVNPSLIMISSCLNGQTGPQAGLAGFGTMGSQLAGFGALAGWPDRPPAGAAGAYTDYIAPKFIAATVLAALEHRRRTGEGQYIDLAQGEASAQFLCPALLDYTVNGRVWERRGNFSPDYAPSGVYPVAGEDRWIAIAARNADEWGKLCAATGHSEWLTDARFATLDARLANCAALDAAIAAWSAGAEVDEVERCLQTAGVPAHRASTSVDVMADPQLQHRNHFISVPDAELGPVTIENSRVIFSRTPARVGWPGPSFGQHNDHVLRDLLGLDDEEIVELVASGALD